jgi:DNA end-binding protein Ku
VIEKKLKARGAKASVADEAPAAPEHATTNVVDFVSLLKRSLAEKAPAKTTGKRATKPPAKRARRSAGKSASTRRRSSRSKR